MPFARFTDRSWPGAPPVAARRDGAADSLERFLHVTRGETTAVYRLRLTDDGAASLEKFENGAFGPPRVFRGCGAGFDPREPSSPAKLDRALRYVATYLDGTVNVGERDLLSPTSALARNVRWFPGDLQMLNTAFHYAVELFPSAQFHVTQLFRRVLGDVAFLSLVLVTSAFWLQTSGPPAPGALATVLLGVSMMAIVGFDRYWEPLRYHARKLGEIEKAGQGWRIVYAAPVLVLRQLVVGTVAVVLNTLVGLANLAINPPRILESWRRLRLGKQLEWKASSVSAGQDMRGWPLDEFTDVYAPATRIGVAMFLFGAWLIALGAPLEILGAHGVGIVASAFVTAALYAWFSALPHAADDGSPLYALPRHEAAKLMGVGAIGILVSVLLLRAGLYPVPAFDGSVAYVALFLSASAAFAFAYPVWYAGKRALYRYVLRDAGSRRAAFGLVGAAAAVALAVFLGRLGAEPGGELAAFFRRDETQWRMSPVERRLFVDVGATMRRHAHADPEPLLRDEGDEVTLREPAAAPLPDFRELRGAPSPRLPKLVAAPALELPELYPLPAAERLVTGKPQREFLVPMAESVARAPLPSLLGKKSAAEARSRSVALVPVAVAVPGAAPSPASSEGEGPPAEGAYPWIDAEELRRWAAVRARDERSAWAESARVERWDDAKALWTSVEAAGRGGVPDRVRLRRLAEGIDGARDLGRDPSPADVQRFLDEELALATEWSTKYPNVPLAQLSDDTLGRGRYFQLAQLVLAEGRSRRELAEDLRLDYVDAYWSEPPLGDALHQVFRDRPRQEPWEKLVLDWGRHEALRARWEDLQTEQVMATRVWRASMPAHRAPTPQELRAIARFLDTVLAGIVTGSAREPYELFAELFSLEGVDPHALAERDRVAALLASRVWTQTMAGRVGRVVTRAAVGEALPGADADRALLRAVVGERYPREAQDPAVRRLLEELVLADAVVTYREIAAGYDKFFDELEAKGARGPRTPRAPDVPESRLLADLFDLWRELPARFPNIPARDDMVSEVLVHTAYLSRKDAARLGARSFIGELTPMLVAVDAVMNEAPPPAVLRLSDASMERSQGRASRSPRARRFFAWLSVAVQARVLEHNFERHGVARRAELRDVAAAWNDVLTTGAERWPHLPWAVPGFAEFFVQVQAVEGWSSGELWSRFERSLAEADALLARHVVPFQAFEALVDRRIAERTGSPSFDPSLRQANAVIALAQLLEVARANAVTTFDGNPALLTERFGLLYEKLAREYPSLSWEGEGTLEFYLLLELKERTDVQGLLARFHPEWALADALAGAGLLDRLEAVAAARPGELSPSDASLRVFVDAQAQRLEEKTGARVKGARPRAMNALVALSTLVLSAGEEGLIPEQRGEPWTKAKVRAWAASQHRRELAPETLAWGRSLAQEWGTLATAMREDGPHFPWHKGAVVEANLLVLRSAKSNVAEARRALGASWRVASDWVARGVVLPPAFEERVLRESSLALKQKIAESRGVPLATIADDEVAPEDPALVHLDAVLVLADVVAQIRTKYGEDPAPGPLAERLVEVAVLGPRRYPFVPWRAKGFVPSLVVAAYRDDLRDDFWRYPKLIDMPEVDALLGDLDPRARRGEGDGKLAEVVADVRTIMRQQTGRTPASDDVVVFQALRDGVFLLKQFLPAVPRTKENVLTMVRLRAGVRRMDAAFPALHIGSTESGALRVGFAERLAAAAMKRGLEAGLDPADDAFVPRCLATMEGTFLGPMDRIYEGVRRSFSPEEMRHYQDSIRLEAREDNGRRAARHGLAPTALSVPDVQVDDVVADFALYEILYASEIGEGPAYLVDLFDILGRLRARPAVVRAHADALAEVDGRFPEARRPGDVGYGAWLEDPRYPDWLEARGEVLKRERGKLVALARTLALVKERAFSDDGDPEARRAFARFGSFEAYEDALLGDFEAVASAPELAAALRTLKDEDPFLADGVQFALALFQRHVIAKRYPDERERAAALAGIASALPSVTDDYRSTLGFVPRLESGVPLYDARVAFTRSSLEGGTGVRLLQKLNLVQRTAQRWTETYLLKHAYKVLFYRDLDEDDETLAARPARAHPIESLRNLVAPRTVGDDVRDFLGERLPAFLEKETGSRDVATWVEWLATHGEVGLDGAPTGKNPYAEELAAYERRLTYYRARIREGEAAGKNVRAEEQRARDLEKELASLQSQVRWLEDGARASVPRTERARRDYLEAVWLHGVVLALAVLALGRLARWGATRLASTERARERWALAGWAVPVLLAVGASTFAAVAPAQAAAAAPVLEAVRLVERGEHGEVLRRGAAAQLAKSQPWRIFGFGAAAELPEETR